MDASESLSMILKWFYFVSAFPVLFNMYIDKDSNLIRDLREVDNSDSPSVVEQ